MNKINLLFTSFENQIEWEKSEQDFNQTTIDLNIASIAGYLEKLNSDFPKIYLLKPCLDINDSNYRLDIMEEVINNKVLFNELNVFADTIKTLSQKLFDYKKETIEIQKKYRYLRIVCDCFSCINKIKDSISSVESLGLKSLYNYTNDIINDDKLFKLNETSKALLIEIEEMLKDNILVLDPKNKLFTFEKCDPVANETDILKSFILDIYGQDVNNSFSIVDPAPLSNMEDKIINELNILNPSTFERLNIFYNDAITFLDEIETFSRVYKQIIFYTTYIDFLNLAASNNIPICKPIFDSLEFRVKDNANISLVINKIEKNALLDTIVLNDIRLPKSKMFFLSGPNQGGKTIYLISVGLIAYLAKCGCFILGRSCRVPFYDNIATHFMKEEVLGKGRLVEEVERIEDFLKKLTTNTLILLNESFTSTRRKDGVKIALHYLQKLSEVGCSVGMVSHYYEIPEIFNNKELIITLSSGKDENGNRNYKVVESTGDGIAYARDIAHKCEMTYEQIVKEIRGEENEKY